LALQWLYDSQTIANEVKELKKYREWGKNERLRWGKNGGLNTKEL
jgi:hypothetical protein